MEDPGATTSLSFRVYCKKKKKKLAMSYEKTARGEGWIESEVKRDVCVGCFCSLRERNIVCCDDFFFIERNKSSDIPMGRECYCWFFVGQRIIIFRELHWDVTFFLRTIFRFVRSRFVIRITNRFAIRNFYLYIHWLCSAVLRVGCEKCK